MDVSGINPHVEEIPLEYVNHGYDYSPKQFETNREKNDDRAMDGSAWVRDDEELQRSWTSPSHIQRQAVHGEYNAGFNRELMDELPSRNMRNFRNEYYATWHPSGKERPRQVDFKSEVLVYSTLRCRNPTRTEEEQLFRMLEEDISLMGSNTASVLKRRETLRNIPQSLTLRRIWKERLSESASNRQKGKHISCFKRFQYKLSMSITKFTLGLRDMLYTMDLWYGSLKTIEGNYGSGVGSYFRFLRFLFLLNLFVAVITFSFIVIPQLLCRLYGSASASDLSPVPEGGTAADMVTTSLSRLQSTTVDQFNGEDPSLPERTAVHDLNSNPEPYQQNGPFLAGDFFTGMGWLNHTELYYGIYKYGVLNIFGDYKYSISSAYIFTVICCLIFSLIVVSYSMAKSYRKNFIDTEGGVKNVYSSKVFCGWDFGITTEEAAVLKSRSIYIELKELLEEDKRKDKLEMGCTEKFNNGMVKCVIHIITVGCIVGTGALMWYLLTKYLLSNESHERNMVGSPSFLEVMQLSLIVTALMLILPMLFSFLARWELYKSPRTVLYVTLVRMLILDAVIIGVVLTFWFNKSSTKGCWESALGQEIYRFLIVDFIVVIIVMFMAELIRNILSKYVKLLGAPEFDIARNAMSLIYTQALFWVGFYFAPLLSLIIIVRLFITFYVRKVSLIYNCQHTMKPWRAAQTNTVFLVNLFLSLLGSIIAFGYTVTVVPTSADCGPFQNLNHSFELLVELGSELDDGYIMYYVLYLRKPGVVTGILIGLCVAVYYLKSLSEARVMMVALLKSQLKLEGKDKVFLLQEITKAQHALNKKRDRSQRKTHERVQHDPGAPGPSSRSDSWKQVSRSEYEDEFDPAEFQARHKSETASTDTGQTSQVEWENTEIHNPAGQPYTEYQRHPYRRWGSSDSMQHPIYQYRHNSEDYSDAFTFPAQSSLQQNHFGNNRHEYIYEEEDVPAERGRGVHSRRIRRPDGIQQQVLDVRHLSKLTPCSEDEMTYASEKYRRGQTHMTEYFEAEIPKRHGF